MSYTHLSQHERYQIQRLHRAGFSARQIGAEISRHASTIHCELCRNTVDESAYDSRHAHR